jgi:hypothetical protein
MKSVSRMVVLAVLAASALAVSAVPALAETPQEFAFSGAAGTNWTGTLRTSPHLQFRSGSLECQEAGLTGVIPAGKTAPVAKAAFSYHGCKQNGITYTWLVTNCEYEFHQPLGYTGTFSIVKGPGTSACKVVLESVSCKITIEAQTPPSSKVTYWNELARLHYALSLGGVKYTQSERCPGGGGSFTDGTYAGEMYMKEVALN